MFAEWNNDIELFALIRRELFTSVIADTLDAHGYLNQMLPPTIKPLRAGMCVLGRAMPVVESDNINADDPYGELFHALDDLKPNEVYIASGASGAYAMWGELMTTAAVRRGAVGAIFNGYVRDTAAILKMDFPVFAWGSYAADQKLRGRAIAFRVPMIIGSVTVNPGDIISADDDGAVIVPQAVEAEIMAEALQKSRAEKTLKRDLEAGMLATVAFKKHGIF